MSSAGFINIKHLEQELMRVLKEEYAFYQSLYIMMDKQRDLLKFNKEDCLLDLFAEIERCYRRIKKSEEKVGALKSKNQYIFKMAIALPEVKKLVNSIATLIKKNLNLVKESNEYMTGRYERIKAEIGQLKNSAKIIQYLTENNPSPQFVDGRK